MSVPSLSIVNEMLNAFGAGAEVSTSFDLAILLPVDADVLKTKT